MIQAARITTRRYGRPYRYLWGARTVSYFGDIVAQVALVLVAARQSDAALAVSLLMLAQTVPQLLGPIAGIVADRMGLRPLMVGCQLGQTLLVVALALLAVPFALVLALVAAMALLETLFLPAGQSALPAIIASADDLSDANALLRLGFNSGKAIGPLVAGALVAVGGVRSALLLDALTFVISAGLLGRLPALAHAPVAAATPPDDPAVLDRPADGRAASARGALTYLAHDATARAVTVGLFLVTLFVALDNVGLVFLAQRAFGSNAAGFGALLAGYGVGIVVAPLILLRSAGRISPAASLLAGIGLMGAGTLLCGLAPTLIAAVIFQGAVGVGNGLQNVANDTLLQRTVPRAILGRIFGIAYSVPNAALLITYSGGGLLLALSSARAVFVIAGLGTLAALVLVWRLLDGSARPAA